MTGHEFIIYQCVKNLDKLKLIFRKLASLNTLLLLFWQNLTKPCWKSAKVVHSIGHENWMMGISSFREWNKDCTFSMLLAHNNQLHRTVVSELLHVTFFHVHIRLSRRFLLTSFFLFWVSCTFCTFLLTSANAVYQEVFIFA